MVNTKKCRSTVKKSVLATYMSTDNPYLATVIGFPGL